MTAGLGRVRRELVESAVRVLSDPDGPGEPWTEAEIAAALPGLVQAPGAPSAAAWTARWLAAIDEGAQLPEPQ